MSYDLTFFPSKPGLDAHAAYREHQDREEREAADYKEWIKRLVPAAERAEMERIAGALQVRHPAFERFQPEQPLPFIELDDKDLQVQVNIRADSTDVTCPTFGRMHGTCCTPSASASKCSKKKRASWRTIRN
jgi:hypothetical protein